MKDFQTKESENQVPEKIGHQARVRSLSTKLGLWYEASFGSFSLVHDESFYDKSTESEVIICP